MQAKNDVLGEFSSSLLECYFIFAHSVGVQRTSSSTIIINKRSEKSTQAHIMERLRQAEGQTEIGSKCGALAKSNKRYIRSTSHARPYAFAFTLILFLIRTLKLLVFYGRLLSKVIIITINIIVAVCLSLKF